MKSKRILTISFIITCAILLSWKYTSFPSPIPAVSEPPSVHFITYGDAKYESAKIRLMKQAENTTWFRSANAFGPGDLLPAFANEYADILREPRGGGYWVWKFPIIARKLESVNEGDVVLYLDAGAAINPSASKRFREYVDMLLASDLDVLSFTMNHQPEHKWTTETIFAYFNVAPDDPIRSSGQHIGGLLLLRKGRHSRKLLGMAKAALESDRWMFSDRYNQAAKQANAEFVDNRHDQSVMSVSRKLIGSVVIPDESYPPYQEQFPFWTHL